MQLRMFGTFTEMFVEALGLATLLQRTRQIP